MDMLNLYPEMNKEIINILRLSGDNPMNLYAAQLIEEQAAKLAAYEATGATPEQVQEWAKAAQDDRLVVLPDTACDLCNSKHIDIKVETKDKNDSYWFSSDPIVGLMYCPLCGRRIAREEAEAATNAQKGADPHA